MHESLVVCEYLDTIYPDNKLIPIDPYIKARHQILCENISKITGPFYKAFRTKDPEANAELEKGLEFFEKTLEKDFFGGDKHAMVDFMIWPWFERLPILKSAINFDINAEKFPKMTAWVNRMQELPTIKKIWIKPESYIKYFSGYPSNLDYDFELQ